MDTVHGHCSWTTACRSLLILQVFVNFFDKQQSVKLLSIKLSRRQSEVFTLYNRKNVQKIETMFLSFSKFKRSVLWRVRLRLQSNLDYLSLFSVDFLLEETVSILAI